jgi:hypothetical protein
MPAAQSAADFQKYIGRRNPDRIRLKKKTIPPQG